MPSKKRGIYSKIWLFTFSLNIIKEYSKMRYILTCKFII